MISPSSCLRQHLTRICRPEISQIAVSTRRPRSIQYLQAHTSILLKRNHGSTSEGATVHRKSNLSNVSPEKRQEDLRTAGFIDYPRAQDTKLTSVHHVLEHLQRNGEQDSLAHEYEVVGRISSVRSAGSNLLFIDIEQRSTAPLPTDTVQSTTRTMTDGQSPASSPHVAAYTKEDKLQYEPVHLDKQPRLQVVVDRSKLSSPLNDGTANMVKRFGKMVQRGDTISVRGSAYVTDAGQSSLRATAMPKLLSPCLRQIPTAAITDDSDFAHDRHVQMLIDPTLVNTIAARSRIVGLMHRYFDEHGFVNVQTPILAASAGGAIARPFETVATEFSDRKLALRIAPELWLKRLIIGGMQRVYEIGPSFRNEGLDKTHNPEFTTSEFYAANWTLRHLQDFTSSLIAHVATDVTCIHNITDSFLANIGLNDSSASFQNRSWPEIDFMPALNEALGTQLPNLSTPTARQEILDLFERKQLPVPSTPTLPRLLDKLSSMYLEPRCTNATWITNIPECLSPLAKSFDHPRFPQYRVAARAELFIQQKEVVNCYEEENSPVEQRRKFIDQQKYATLDNDKLDDEAMKIDEDYIRALEWGLPPTGGWGCGIDRLCMLMLGKEKISDVLTFGNLRMVAKGAGKRDKVENIDT